METQIYDFCRRVGGKGMEFHNKAPQIKRGF